MGRGGLPSTIGCCGPDSTKPDHTCYNDLLRSDLTKGVKMKNRTLVINDAQPGTGLFVSEHDDILPMPPSLEENRFSAPRNGDSGGVFADLVDDDSREIQRENERRLGLGLPPVPVANNTMHDGPTWKPPVDNSRMDPDDVLPLPRMEW